MTTPLHVACYGDLRAWFRRRRRAILITAGAVGAGCLLYYGYTRYYSLAPSSGSSSRVRAVTGAVAAAAGEDEEEVRTRSQEEAEERVLQLRRHFDGIQVLSDTTTLPPVLAQFKERLLWLINLTELTRQLMAGKEGTQALTHDEKLTLWQKLKFSSFTRAFCAAWGLGLAHLFVRVQLNVLGRRMYINTARDVSEGTSEQDLPISTQEKFLSLSDFLPKQGVELLVKDTEQAVQQILKDVSLKKMYAFDELRDLLIKIQAEFEQQHKDWCRYLLPQSGTRAESSDIPDTSESEEAEADANYEQLVIQLREVLSSIEFQEVLGTVIDTLADMMMQELRPVYQTQPAVGLPLAKLVPAVASLGGILEFPEDNKYVRTIAELPQVKSFCTLVYGSPE